MTGLRGFCLIGSIGVASILALSASVWAEQDWRTSILKASSNSSAPTNPEADRNWFPVVIQPPKNDVATVASKEIVAQSDVPKRSTRARKLPRPDPQPAPSPRLAPKPQGSGDEKSQLADDYCASVADAAAEARFAWQMRTLKEMEEELGRRIVILEQRAAEYREWLARRDAFVSKAQDALVQIYARMRPDAAASQLANLDEETAAAVLSKLNPRSASAILNEMPPVPAARLTATIAGAAKVDEGAGAQKDEPRS